MNTKDKTSYRIIIWRLITGSVLTALAIVFIYSSIFIIPEDNRKWRGASLEATGIVVGLRETYRNRAYCEYPEIRFTAENNRTVSFFPYDCYGKGVYRVGQHVRVRYNAEDPSIAYIDLGDNDRSTSVALILFSVFLLICGAAFLVMSFKKNEAGTGH